MAKEEVDLSRTSILWLTLVFGVVFGVMLGVMVFSPAVRTPGQIADNIEWIVYNDDYPHQHMRNVMESTNIGDLKGRYTHFRGQSRRLLEIIGTQICYKKLTPDSYNFTDLEAEQWTELMK